MYSHLLHVLCNEAGVFYFLGVSHPQEKMLGRGGGTCRPRCFSFSLLIFPFSVRALQIPFPDEQTLQQCILGSFGSVQTGLCLHQRIL